MKGSLKNTQGLQLAVSGDVRHSIPNLAMLPPVLGLDAMLGKSDIFIEGRRLFKNTKLLHCGTFCCPSPAKVLGVIFT